MSRKIREHVRIALSSLAFYARNVWRGRVITPFTPTRLDAIVIEPLTRRHIRGVIDLYASINGGKRLSFKNLVLLSMLGSRLGLVARNSSTGAMVGMVFYYFNDRDARGRRPDIIHVGFTGLHEAVRGIGVAAFMRQYAIENFARSGLSGVSSRISTHNVQSLKGNERLGFVPVEEYFDQAMGESRVYLICDLNSYRKRIFTEERTLRT